MKIIFTLLMIFCAASLSHAQNSVEIKQTGNGNKVSINQSGREDKKRPPCNEAEALNGQNVIAVNGQDVSAVFAGINLFDGIIHNQDIKADQTGSGNNLFLYIPDTTKSGSFKSGQEGEQNFIVARLSGDRNSISIHQEGQSNEVKINPCQSATANNKQKNDVQVSSNGNSNSVTITQQ